MTPKSRLQSTKHDIQLNGSETRPSGHLCVTILDQGIWYSPTWCKVWYWILRNFNTKPYKLSFCHSSLLSYSLFRVVVRAWVLSPRCTKRKIVWVLNISRTGSLPLEICTSCWQVCCLKSALQTSCLDEKWIRKTLNSNFLHVMKFSRLESRKRYSVHVCENCNIKHFHVVALYNFETRCQRFRPKNPTKHERPQILNQFESWSDNFSQNLTCWHSVVCTLVLRWSRFQPETSSINTLGPEVTTSGRIIQQ